VDLALVKGTGRHGRVLEQDVKSYVKEHVGKAVAASGGFVLPEAPFVDFARFGLIESQPLSRIKRVTATHLHAPGCASCTSPSTTKRTSPTWKASASPNPSRRRSATST
jgi:hypothetical protein